MTMISLTGKFKFMNTMTFRLLVLMMFLAGFQLDTSAQGFMNKHLSQDYFERMKALKDGQPLLIVLNNENRKLEAMKKANKIDLRNRTKLAVAKRHQTIVTGFEKHYTFSSVYFVYDDDKAHIKSGKLKKVKFYNSDLKRVRKIHKQIDINKLLLVTLNNTWLKRVDKNPQTGRDTMTKAGAEALHVLDDDFIRLTYPFPRRVKTYASVPLFKRDFTKVVEKLDLRFHRYFSKFRLVKDQGKAVN
ncbi:MAG: hypothetical protein ACPGVE_04605 [Flavobacteriales bacterium]